MYIGGVGVAKGYWKNPELSAQKFILHPCSGECLYKTGDLGKYMRDGNIEFLGRVDYQVKVGGYRIDISGLESFLVKHDLVEQAVIIPKKTGNRYSGLHAYVRLKNVLSNVGDRQKLFEQQVQNWKEVYEDINSEKCEKDIMFNTSGWVNGYTGERFSC